MKTCCRHTWHALEDDERRRDVFRPASKKQLEPYLTALSSTLIQLQDHPDFLHLNGGVSASPEQLGLAQRGEVFPLPLDQGARSLFFNTLRAELHSASDLRAPVAGDRPQFLLVLKSIGQKVSYFCSTAPNVCFRGGDGHVKACCHRSSVLTARVRQSSLRLNTRDSLFIPFFFVYSTHRSTPST